MQYHSKIAILVTLAIPLASSQSLSNLPQCAVAPVLASIGNTGCGLMDFACSCSNAGFLASLEPVVAQACSAADYAVALSLASSACLSVGVTISTTPAVASTTAAEPTAAYASDVSSTTTSAPVADYAGSSTSAGTYSQTTSSQFQSATTFSNSTSNLTSTSSITLFTGSASSFRTQGSSMGVLIGAVGVFFALQ